MGWFDRIRSRPWNTRRSTQRTRAAQPDRGAERRRTAVRRPPCRGPHPTGAVTLASWLLGIYGVLYAMIARDEGAVGSEMLIAALIGGVLLGGAVALILSMWRRGRASRGVQR